MRVKVSECASMFWSCGRLVWDDSLRHKQLPLSESGERVVRWFASWREIDSVRELGDGFRAVADQLVSAGVLVAERSIDAKREDDVLAQWRAWGSAARHYHFSQRTSDATRFVPVAVDVQTSREKARLLPPPAPLSADASRALVALAPGRPDDAGWERPRLLDALWNRRSVRQFSDEPVTSAQLAAVLEAGGGIVEVREDPDFGRAVFKTSPSPGGCSPIELYVIVQNVAGIRPGVYHFAPARGGLEEVGPLPTASELLGATGGQPWLAQAPALIVYTAVAERSQWRYETGRGYRDVLIGLGHVSQTVLLTASAIGLGAVFATAVSDEDLERILGVDPVQEPVLGVAAIGRKANAT